MRLPSGPPFYRSVAQSSERAAWAREVAGENPAVPTNFKLLPWSNTSGIRLLSGTMQVEVLPAAPLPGSVKVARRPVKPFGVGASPTLAAILQFQISNLRPCSTCSCLCWCMATAHGMVCDPATNKNHRCNERRPHEACDSTSKQIASPQKLQAKTGHSNPFSAEGDIRVPARRVRIEARN